MYRCGQLVPLRLVALREGRVLGCGRIDLSNPATASWARWGPSTGYFAASVGRSCVIQGTTMYVEDGKVYSIDITNPTTLTTVLTGTDWTTVRGFCIHPNMYVSAAATLALASCFCLTTACAFAL